MKPYIAQISMKRNQTMKANIIKYCKHHETKLITCLYQKSKPNNLRKILPIVLHEIYKKTHEKNFKNPPKSEDNDPFRNGCYMLEKWAPKELKRPH